MYYIKKYLEDLERKRSGTYRKTDSGLFLDRNERTVPYESIITKSLYDHLLKINIGLYPEIEPFYEKLSNWLGINKEEIYITEGVDGAVKALTETLTIPGKNNIVFPNPTFALYPVYCEMFEVKPILVGYLNNYDLNFQELLSSINGETAIVFLPNPNMPIEGSIEIGRIKILAEYCLKRNVMLVLDEVYYPFGELTGIELTKEFHNVLVMRSFSKAFGLAGIRLGYLIGNKKIINYVSKTRTGYESNSVSIGIASFFIDHYGIVSEYVQEVKKGLSFLKSKLDHFGIEYNGGDIGNFIFINLNNSVLAQKIVRSLIQKNIYVRGGWPAPFDGGISVTGAPKHLMEIFFNEFKSLLFEKKGKL